MIFKVIKNILNTNKNANEVARFSGFFKSRERLIFKCVDENRELLELLIANAPDFLEKHSWVESWLKSQDELLLDIVDIASLPHPNHQNRVPEFIYPRPWPQVPEFNQ